MDLTINKIATVTFLSALAIVVLPACEKGLMMKDPRISTPDFNVKVQTPGGDTGEKSSFIIDLKSVQVRKTEKTMNSGTLVHPDAAESSSKEVIEAQIEFAVGNGKSAEASRLVKLVADIDATSEFNSHGTIANEEAEPEMTWQARCVEKDCAKVYVSIAFHFMDSEQKLQDMKYLVVGVHREQNLVKRNLFPAVVELNTLSKQIEALEMLDAKKTTMPTAGNTPVAQKADITTLGGHQKPSVTPQQASHKTILENRMKVEESIDPVNYDIEKDKDMGDANEEL